MQDQTTPHPTVARRRAGVNGLPEPEDLTDDNFGDDLAESPAAGRESNNDQARSAAAWAAFGAVAVSSLFALRTALRLRRRRNRAHAVAAWRAEHGTRDSDVTPPHGDKLMSRERANWQ